MFNGSNTLADGVARNAIGPVALEKARRTMVKHIVEAFAGKITPLQW
jgi:hypothetical protein